jgi:hypothetical protein
MTIYTWPTDLPPSEVTFFLESNAAISESPLSRSQQVLARPGTRWVAQLGFARRPAHWSGRIDALLALLAGPENELRLWDFRRPAPRGTATPRGSALRTRFGDATEFSDGTRFLDQPAAPTVTVAVAEGAASVPTGGWAPSQAAALLAGDYVGIGGRLFLVAEDVATDSAGRGTLVLRPRLRATVPGGTAVVTDRPTARFRLADNRQGANPTQPGPFSTYNLSLLESLP